MRLLMTAVYPLVVMSFSALASTNSKGVCIQMLYELKSSIAKASCMIVTRHASDIPASFHECKTFDC